MTSKSSIGSYVNHEDKCFYVSTITRESSAMLAAGHLYNETIVWEWDWVKHERGRMLYQDEDSRSSIAQHLEICDRLWQTGSPEKPEPEEN